MLVTMTSSVSRKVNTREIDVTIGQIVAWKSGQLIQDVMPHLSKEDREFLMSGTTPEEWNEMFSTEDE